MVRADPEADKAYQREYMRLRRARLREEKMGITEPTKKQDFSVATANIGKPEKTLDLNSKEIQALLKLAEKANKKDADMGDDDKILKYMAKAAEYMPMVQEITKNLFAGFNAAALNAQQARAPVQEQNRLRAPEGWEHMTGLQRLGKKYSSPEWYAAGETYEAMKATGGAQYVTPVNTGYVDPTYRQPPQEPRNLRELRNKYPEPPVVSDTIQNESVENSNTQSKPAFVKKAEEKKQEEPQVDTELINAMREDNNKYIMLAFNYLNVMDMEEFKGYVQNIDTLKPKFQMLNVLLPIQTREMLKKTTSDELVDVFSEKCPEKYKWLKEEKKIPEMKNLFEELKGGLQ